MRTKSGRYYHDFKLNNYVALGWNKISDLLIQDDRTTEIEKRNIIQNYYPDESRPGLILGQVRIFCSQMKQGDYIVIPSKNSESLSIGVLGDIIINDIFYKHTYDEYEQCPYNHKRSVTWLNEIIPINDIYISRILKSHQTITNISEYANVLYRNISPLYIDDNSIHLTLQKSSRSEMKMLDNIKLQDSIYNIISKISSLYSSDTIDDSISIKTAVGSPGFIEIISVSALAIPGILFILQNLFGNSKDKNGNGISGISSIMAQISSCFDAKVDRELKRVEIEGKQISNKKADKELALVDLQIEKEKADIRRLNAEATSVEIKNLEALQSLLKPDQKQILNVSSQLDSHITTLTEVIDDNEIRLPSSKVNK